MPKAGGECNSYRRHQFAFGAPIWALTGPNRPKTLRNLRIDAGGLKFGRPGPILGPTAKHMGGRRPKAPPFQTSDEGIPVTIIDQGNGAAVPAAADLIKDTTTQTFVKDVIEESKRQPVLIDFWAEWCGPCKQLTPIIEKVIRAAKGKAKLVKMNIDEHPAIPGQMGIQSIPAVIAFVNGQPADGFLGALPESQVTAFLERLVKDRVGGEEKDLLKAADAALAEGDSAGAAELYAQILANDSGNVAALAGLAPC